MIRPNHALILAGLVAIACPCALRAAPRTNVLFIAIAELRAWQEQQYREREVLDPATGEWQALPPKPPATPSGVLDEARGLLAEDKPKAAGKLLEDWIEENPDHERYYEAVFLLGQSLYMRELFYQAYEQYEQVVDNTSGDLFRAALERERDVAQAFLSGKKRVVWKIFRFPAYDEAIEILDRVWERVPGTRLGEEALLIKANYFYNRGDMDLAQDEYAHLAQEYPAGRFVQFAMLRSAVAAEAAFPGIRFDDRPLVEAQERYRQLQQAFPVYAERENIDQRLRGIREARAEKDLTIARWYQRTRQPASAEFYYRLVLRDWPETLAATEARQALRDMGAPLDDEESGS